jgi:hypothetical protein
MGENEFSVCQFFANGDYEYVRRWVSAQEAVQAPSITRRALPRSSAW